MTEIIRDTCRGRLVRYTIDENGGRWFFATDLANAAGYTNTGFIFRGLGDHRVDKTKDPITGRTHRTIHQTAAVACLATSRKPEAKWVMDWISDLVCSEQPT